MKRIFVVACALAVLATAAVAGPKEFVKGAFYLTPQIGLNSWGGSIPFGAAGEFALTPNLGVGGSIMAQFWSDEGESATAISFSAEALYHFTKLQAEKFDLAAGGGLGYTTVSWSGGGFGGALGSGIYLEAIAAARYWVSPKIAVSLRILGALVGGDIGFGAQLGATFRLK